MRRKTEIVYSLSPTIVPCITHAALPAGMPLLMTVCSCWHEAQVPKGPSGTPLQNDDLIPPSMPTHMYGLTRFMSASLSLTLRNMSANAGRALIVAPILLVMTSASSGV